MAARGGGYFVLCGLSRPKPSTGKPPRRKIPLQEEKKKKKKKGEFNVRYVDIAKN